MSYVDEPTAPATGSVDPEQTDLLPEDPPVTGTLLITLLLLMFIFGFWAMMYITLLNR